MVLLHVIEAPRPIEAGGVLAGRERLVEQMQDFAAALLGINHVRGAEVAAIAGLAAALRIERGLVEDGGRLAVEVADLDDARAERGEVGVLEIEAGGHGWESSQRRCSATVSSGRGRARGRGEVMSVSHRGRGSGTWPAVPPVMVLLR